MTSVQDASGAVEITQKKNFSQTLAAQSARKEIRVSLAWENIDLAIAVKDAEKSSFMNTVYKKKQILHAISGHAVSGELLAIMGPTGSVNPDLCSIVLL